MPGGAEPLDWEQVFRQAVLPVASAYAGWLLVLRSYRRGRSRRTVLATGPEPRYRDLAAYLLRTTTMGYVVFLLIVGVFYLVLGNESPELLRDALVRGAALAFGVAFPGLLLIAWLYDRRR